MRNLVALRRAVWRLPHEDSDARACMAVNSSEQVVYVMNAASGLVQSLAIDDDTAEATPLVALGDAIFTPDGAAWTWIEYIAELDAIVCGASSGTLAVVDLQSLEPEEIGVLDGGIAAMAWSSNQETLAIVTGVGSLLVMNTQWEVLHETPIATHLPTGLTLPAELTRASLAWRDDAQFLVLNAGAIAANGQGVRKVLVFTNELALHAVGRLEDGRDISHLGDSLDWCPNHSLIASHERRKDQQWIVFFERNGLRHGEFALPAEHTRVRRVLWNTQSDVLAVHVDNEAESAPRLLLYHRSNYHWYLKQELAFDALLHVAWDAERSALLHLLVEQQGQLQYEQREFAWDVSIGERQQNGAASVVAAVIDGARLLLTPLHQALVPPPMALHSLTFDAAVNAVAFDAFHDTLAVLLASGHVIAVHDFLSTASRAPLLVDAAISSLLFLQRDESDSTDPSIIVAAKRGEDDALAVWRCDTAATESLPLSQDVHRVARASEVADCAARRAATRLHFALQTHAGAVLLLAVDQSTAHATPVSSASALPLASRLEVLRASDSRLVTVTLSAATAKLAVDGTPVAAAACSSFRFCVFSHALLFTTLGAAAHLRFLPFQSLLAPSTASSSSDSDAAHRVVERGARIVAVVGDRASVVLQLPRGNLEAVSPRLLVLARATALLQSQAYRPALELARRHRLDLNLLVDFAPRAFLQHVASGLVDAYVSEAPRVASDRLSLLLTSLHVVDVWTTKYQPQLLPFLTSSPEQEEEEEEGSRSSPFTDGQDKVNTVCRAVMRAISDHDQRHSDPSRPLLLPYLTAAVKQSPPDLTTALATVQQLLPDPAAAKRAVQHLVFLTHVDSLFDAALGLYDLPLVRFVAGFSPRDPKDYVPFLDACAAITHDDRRRKLAIDRHLQRHDRALALIASLLLDDDRGDGESTDDDERVAAEIVAAGQLFDQALALFPAAATQPAATRVRRKVLMLKAEHLAASGDHEAAAYVYLSLELLEQAMRAFKHARQWRMAMATAARAGLAGPPLHGFAREVGEALLSQTHMDSATVLAAAQLYADYGGDADEAVALLVAHKLWDESVRVAHVHQRADLLETEVAPGALAAYALLVEDVAQRQREYVLLWQRLTRIREQKRLFKLHGIDGSRWEERGDGDAQSLASGVSSVADSARSAASARSVGSHNSVARSQGNFALQSLTAATGSHFYSTQSQSQFGAASAQEYKSRRYGGLPSRTERKRRIKEGSMEEEAHVAAQLHAAAPSAALLREVRDVLRALVVFGHSAEAEKLQAALQGFQRLISSEYPLLEPPPAAAAAGAEPQTQEAVTAPSATDDSWSFPAF